MPSLNPWKHGTVLALTVAINYLFCTILWTLFTDSAVSFLNALFHGLDFRRLTVDAGFNLRNQIYALVVLTAWAYVLGVIYALIRNWLPSARTR